MRSLSSAPSYSSLVELEQSRREPQASSGSRVDPGKLPQSRYRATKVISGTAVQVSAFADSGGLVEVNAVGVLTQPESYLIE